jgi:hypothetical protein
MSLDKINKTIRCDVKGCNNTNTVLSKGGLSYCWVNKDGHDICPDCRRKAQDAYGSNWYIYLKFI